MREHLSVERVSDERRGHMRTTRALYLGMVACSIGVLLASGQARLSAQSTDPAIRIGDKDLGGVVTSSKGPEAGVWVIAEATDLPTRFAKIVVTDDRGRYLIPDLPKATYSVWVRGYGLVDSQKVKTTPGKNLNLTALIAPDARAAAQYYPAGYWASLISVPEKTDFPGTGTRGNGISPGMKTQGQFLAWLKNGSCYTCHQLGDKPTREGP